MNSSEILKEAFPEADVAGVDKLNCLSSRIVDDQFDGKRTVARQQAVYAPLNSYIASGAVHAVTIRAMTKTNGANHKLFGANNLMG